MIYGDLGLGTIHKTIEKAIGLKIYASGQDVESAPLPFVMYQVLQETKWKEYQRLHKITKEGSTYTNAYEFPTQTEIQYSVHYTSKQMAAARKMIRQLYMYLATDEFKMTLDGVGFTIMSAIRETQVPKDQFFEQQESFDVRWLWRDGMKSNTAETIETAADPIEESAPSGA